jgi:outer membrane receptor protein involved in Fe transport
MTAALCGTAAAIAFGIGLGAVTPARAQSDQPTASSGGFEEITVVARRREERLQTVPMSITAFSAANLRSAQIQNLVDLQHSVPSLTYNPTQRSGIGSDPTLRGLPGVVTYFAEVPLLQGNQIGDYQALDKHGRGRQGAAGHSVRPEHDRRRNPIEAEQADQQLRGLGPGAVRRLQLAAI